MRSFGLARPIALVNGCVVAEGGLCTSIRFDTRVRGLDERPRRGDVVVDLNGAFVLPGLINAHDHLELNHYGRLKVRDRYANASEWIDDLRPLIQGDARIRAGRHHRLADRLFIGALKNVLAGVTTVAHHNPIYRELTRVMPIRPLVRFGWAHSFALEDRPVGAHGEPGGVVADRCAETPHGAPFIMHLGEGTDPAAAGELLRLDAIGCLRSTTVMVHGVALTSRDWRHVVETGAGLVWCPASNLFLFGRTAPVRSFLDADERAWEHVALGSDSRVTGAADLLHELRAAATAAPVSADELLRMVTSAPARMLRLTHAGRIAAGSPADLLVVPPRASSAAASLLALHRSATALVTVGGRPLVADPSFASIFTGRRMAARPIVVDGSVRLASARLARQIERCAIQEPGVEVTRERGARFLSVSDSYRS
jgi:cytosine/adenosine deaminase-related metal-dependent hydrolase